MEDNILQQESFALEIVLVKNSSVDHHLMLMPWMLNSTDAGDTHFEIPAWRITLWSVVFGLMVISSCFGNAFVIRIVLSDKKMCTVTNYFLASAILLFLRYEASKFHVYETFNNSVHLKNRLIWPFPTCYSLHSIPCSASFLW